MRIDSTFCHFFLKLLIVVHALLTLFDLKCCRHYTGVELIPRTHGNWKIEPTDFPKNQLGSTKFNKDFILYISLLIYVYLCVYHFLFTTT